jgi:intracellular sulfur oxidation DsrE/DsrF family protein
MFIKTQLNAGEVKEYKEVGNFFRLMESERELTVIYYVLGSEIARAEYVKGGYAEMFGREFDAVKIISASGQNAQFVIRNASNVYYDTPPVGNVNVVNNNGTFSQFVETVNSDADIQLLPINQSRHYLMVQNLSESQVVYLSFSGVVVIGAGIKLHPGAAFAAENFTPSNEVRALANEDGASVIVVEG